MKIRSSATAAACPRISTANAPATVLHPSAAILPAAASMALRSLPRSASLRPLLKVATFCCRLASASLAMASNASIQPGVSDAIWLSVVQRKVDTTLRRSTTFQ